MYKQTTTQQPHLTIVKIGGNVVDNAQALEQFLDDFAKLQGAKLLIHGGGAILTQMSQKLGLETKMIDGRRITDAPTLRLATMVYAGWINKSIVAQLQSRGCNAIGLSGADANVIPATKRPPNPIDYGYVGDPDPKAVNTDIIHRLLQGGTAPVFCAITHDTNGSLLNTNADTIASTLAIALAPLYSTSLCYCFEKEGLLGDINNPESIIPTITHAQAEELKAQGIIAGGMIPKIDNSFRAIAQGVSEVRIMHARNLLTGRGTVLH